MKNTAFQNFILNKLNFINTKSQATWLTGQSARSPNWRTLLAIGVIGSSISIQLFLFLHSLPLDNSPLLMADWKFHLRPATIALLSGLSPYSIPGVYNPPWAFLPLIPFTLFPKDVSGFLVYLTFIIGILFAAWKLGAKPFVLALLILNPAVWRGALLGNIEWLVALGLVMPPQLGLFFVLMKPQIGTAIAAFWLFEAIRQGGYREVIRVFTPVSIAFLASLALFGLWPLGVFHSWPVGMNVSWWPWGLAVGLVLLSIAIRKRARENALAASIFFSPYIGISSLSIPVLALVSYPLEFTLATIALWIATFLLL